MGASNSNNTKKMAFYNLKAKIDETKEPTFDLTEKVNDSWQKKESFDTISGLINSAALSKREYPKGTFFNVFELILEDEGELSKIQMTHNSLTYNIINALASNINKIEPYSINVYRSKSKSDNGTIYYNGGANINVNGSKENLKWSIDVKSVPKKEPVIMPDGTPFLQQGKQVFDSTKQKLFWEQFFQEKIINVLNGISSSNNKIHVDNISSENINQSNDNDDLPF